MNFGLLIRFFKEVRHHWLAGLIVFTTGIILSVVTAQLPIYFGSLVNIFQKGQKDSIYQMALLLIVLALGQSFFRYIHSYRTQVLSEQIAQDYRRLLEKRILTLNLKFHNRIPSGDLISRILNDVTAVQLGLKNIVDLLREPILFLYLLVNLFLIDWKLTLSLILFLPPIFSIMRNIGRSVSKYSDHGQVHLAGMTSIIKESIDGIRTVQTFNLENKILSRFNSLFQNYLEARKRVFRRVEIVSPVTELLAFVAGVLILLYMYLEVSKGESSYGDFATYVTSLLILSKPIKVLQESLMRVQVTLVSLARIYEIIDDPSVIKLPENPKSFPKNWKEIRFEKVSFKYAHETVLKEVSLTVRRGEKVALVGPSGSGKTTLINLLPRLFEPTSGQILIDDIPLEQFELKELRSQIALVSQDIFLFNDSIAQNVIGDLQEVSDPLKVRECLRQAAILDFVEQLPLKDMTMVGDRGVHFSGGERQRIALARAFYKNAPILLLDEATSALDAQNESLIQSTLRDLMEDKTCLIVAHRLSSITFADRIFVFKKGVIVEQGTHPELYNRPSQYRALYDLFLKN